MIAITSVHHIDKNIQIYKNSVHKNQVPNNNINFQGKLLENRGLNNNLILFSQNFADSLTHVICDKKAFLGQGMSKRAYSLEKIGLKDYVLGVPLKSKLEDLQKKFSYVKNYFPNNNFGQTIAENDAGIVIMKKVAGVPHGISSDIIANNNRISEKAALKFCQQLKVLSEFKDYAYIDLAAQFKVINKDNRFFVDVNPNNLLVDFENQKFNLIDLDDKNIIPMHYSFKSDVNTMISIILDGLMHMNVYEKLDEAGKKSYSKFSQIIINKCKKAANIVNLEKSPITMGQYFDLLMNYDTFIHNRQHNKQWSERYNLLREHYKSVLPFEEKLNLHSENIIFNEKDIMKNFAQSEKYPPFYLSFLYKMNFLNKKQIIDIMDNTPEKLCKQDYKYFVEHKLPITKYDTPEIVECRLKCMNAEEYNINSPIYIDNIDNILKTEFQKINKVSDERKMVIIVGLPASGKNILCESKFKDYYLADVDAIKMQFPIYEKESKQLNNLHNISRHILQQQIIPEVLTRGKNIVIPTTGMSEYVERLAQMGKKNNYNTELIYISSNEEDSVKYSAKRYKETGKFIDPYFIKLRYPYMKNLINSLKNSELIDKIHKLDADAICKS